MQYHLTTKYIQHLIQFYSFWDLYGSCAMISQPFSTAQQFTAVVSVHRHCFFQHFAMGMTIIMKMTLNFVSTTESKCSCPQTCTQELPTCMIIIQCLGSLGRAVRLVLLYFLQPNHSSFFTFLFVYLLLVHLFFGIASTPFSPLSFCGPILHILTTRAVDFILSLALLYRYINRLIAPTSIYMQFLCQYTASTTWVSGVECLFLRSAEVLW